MNLRSTIVGLAGILLGLGNLGAQTVETQIPWRAVSPVPCPASVDLPDWLGRATLVSEEADSLFAMVAIPVQIPPRPGDLAITFYFDEAQSDLLRVYWDSEVSQERLSENLCEGTGLNNRRTLIIPEAQVKKGGTLYVQSGSDHLGLWQVELEWLERKTILAADGATVPGVVLSQAPPLSGEEAGLLPARPAQDEWKGRVVSAPLTERPERVEDGVILTASLEGQPSQVRFSMKIAGLGLDYQPVLRINNRKPLVLNVSVPELNDTAFRFDPTGQAEYVGWREATVWVPADFLQPGENRLELAQDFNGVGFSQPVAVKDVKLQLRFTSAPSMLLPALESEPLFPTTPTHLP